MHQYAHVDHVNPYGNEGRKCSDYSVLFLNNCGGPTLGLRVTITQNCVQVAHGCWVHGQIVHCNRVSVPVVHVDLAYSMPTVAQRKLPVCRRCMLRQPCRGLSAVSYVVWQHVKQLMVVCQKYACISAHGKPGCQRVGHGRAGLPVLSQVAAGILLRVICSATP
jgi:hypothetical protein